MAKESLYPEDWIKKSEDDLETALQDAEELIKLLMIE